jgi:methanethiol S-methyltransferase
MPVTAIRDRIHFYTSRMLATAWLGAALFVISLGYFGYFYLVILEQPGGALAAQAPVAAAVNIALFSAFALHHSLFARTGMKAALARIVPAPLERASYVWMASLLFLAVCGFWQPVPGVAWESSGALRAVLYGVQLAGIIVTVDSASRLDVWDLAGVRQVRAARSTALAEHPVAAADSRPPQASSPAPLELRGPYRWLRHPIYLGWVLLVFGAPTMTMGRLLFATVSTAYLVVAIPIEERSLVHEFGEDYRTYQRQVRWRLVPGLW